MIDAFFILLRKEWPLVCFFEKSPPAVCTFPRLIGQPTKMKCRDQHRLPNLRGTQKQIPPTLRDLQPTKPNYGNNLYVLKPAKQAIRSDVQCKDINCSHISRDDFDKLPKFNYEWKSSIDMTPWFENSISHAVLHDTKKMNGSRLGAEPIFAQ